MDKTKIGKKLLYLRGTKSRDDVAKELGISPSTLAMYETGKRIPRDETKVKIANYYDVDIVELFYTA
ncbi:MAG: helix-turn-helix transcriptional regulator [Clostridia bacterium]|nr:helix-turn-helix transcriptional regulator [Clostridia bacterium]